MITIAQIKKMPVGTKLAGFANCFTIKTAKKSWPVGDEWMHQVLLTDKTGDMLADVNIGKYIPLIGGSEIRIIVAEVQETEVRNVPTLKLYVDQFELPVCIGDSPMEDIDYYLKTVRSKVKCLLVAAYTGAGNDIDKQLEYAEDPKLSQIIDSIIKGE